MAGEFVVINPRRRHRRRRARRNEPNRRRRYRRHYARRNEPNPRRRRHRRRFHHRRLRHNPRGRGAQFMGVNVGQIGMATVGYVGTRVLTGFALKFLPPDWSKDANTATLVRLGTKTVLGVVAPLFLRRFIGRGLAHAWMLGGGIAVLTDAFETWVMPAMGLSLADYQVYPGGELTGYDASTGELHGSAYSESLYAA